MNKTEKTINFIADLLIVVIALAAMVVFCMTLIPLVICIYVLSFISRVLILFCAPIAGVIVLLWRKCFHTDETPKWIDRLMSKVDSYYDEY
jgi:membrane protein implicated in regulation of membrane protease activity